MRLLRCARCRSRARIRRAGGGSAAGSVCTAGGDDPGAACGPGARSDAHCGEARSRAGALETGCEAQVAAGARCLAEAGCATGCHSHTFGLRVVGTGGGFERCGRAFQGEGQSEAKAVAKAKAAAKRAEARRRAAKAKEQRAARVKAAAAKRAPKPKVAPPPVAAAEANDNRAPWLELLIPFGLVCLGVGAVALWSRRRRDPVEDVPVVEPAAAAPVAPIAAPMPVALEWEPEPFDEFVTEEMPFVADDEPEVCTIRAWRGYVKWQFYATVGRGGVDYPAGESKVFRSSGNGIPDETPAARAAYDALVAKLARDGWTTSDSAVEGWYADRFVRAGSDTPAPAGEDIFDVGSLLAGREDEEVALPDDGAAARGNGVAVAMDDGDHRVSG